MSVKIGTEAAQFPDKEYINGIFVAVQVNRFKNPPLDQELYHLKEI
jgi:hypothetical protein